MIAGIDLGTTHSLIGLWRDGKAELVPNALGDLLTPSVVGINDEGEVMVGASARERLITHPKATVANFKRHMGSRHEVKLGKRTFRPEELSALVLRSLVDDVQARTGQVVEEAIISVPAYFSDAQRKATRSAGELAGIRVERLINEPTAAALAYGLEQREAESRFMVLDLGGGTFDVSLLECFEGVMEVHATAGDNFLGGEDFLDALVAAACTDLRLDAARLSPRELAHLRSQVEDVKRQLSAHARIEKTLVLDKRSLPWTMDEARFESLCAALLTRVRTPVERTLRDSGLMPADLDEIVLVGGASRMPMVSRMVARLFGRLPLRHLSPDQVIAIGAAAAAGMKARDSNFRDVVMTDVCPYTLGIAVTRVEDDGSHIDGLFSPIIQRNTTVPVSRVERYQPIRDKQPKLDLKVYQGESMRVAQNILLGEIPVPLPKLPKEQVHVDVRFTYDINGLLEVEACVHPGDRTERIVIQQNPGLLSEAEARECLARLASLKIHPREDQANQAVMLRAERLYEEHLGERRESLMSAMTAFERELASQDTARIEAAREAFTRFLDALESVQGPFQ